MSPLDRLHVEVTNVCNFNCEFCPDGIMTRSRGHMDFALLEKILDEVAATGLARIITFHLMGEPMIYPRIFDAIAAALDRGLQLHLTTNGSTLHLFPDHIAALVQSRLPKVTLSLQTPDAATFPLRGAPPRLTADAYFEGITRYVQASLQAVDCPTRIHVKFLDSTPHRFLVPHKPMTVIAGQEAMRSHLWEWATRLLADIPDGVDPAKVERAIAAYQPGRWHLIPLHAKLVLETFPLDSWGNGETASVIPAQWGYCNGAAQQAGILHDGTVVPCCKDYEGQIPLGHVRSRPLLEILTAAPACRLRSGFNRLQIRHPVCQRCLGADSPTKTRLRQAGSVAYFKAYRPLMKRLYPGWGEV